MYYIVAVRQGLCAYYNFHNNSVEGVGAWQMRKQGHRNYNLFKTAHLANGTLKFELRSFSFQTLCPSLQKPNYEPLSLHLCVTEGWKIDPCGLSPALEKELPLYVLIG